MAAYRDIVLIIARLISQLLFRFRKAAALVSGVTQRQRRGSAYAASLHFYLDTRPPTPESIYTRKRDTARRRGKRRDDPAGKTAEREPIRALLTRPRTNHLDDKACA